MSMPPELILKWLRGWAGPLPITFRGVVVVVVVVVLLLLILVLVVILLLLLLQANKCWKTFQKTMVNLGKKERKGLPAPK